MGSNKTVARSFNLTLTGGWDSIPLPEGVIIRGLTFKCKSTANAIEYRHLEGVSTTIPVGGLWQDTEINWRTYNVEVKGTAADVVDGEYWV